MTAGREQDARETLRVIRAAINDPSRYVPRRQDINTAESLAEWQARAVLAALLPSPPATVGADAEGWCCGTCEDECDCTDPKTCVAEWSERALRAEHDLAVAQAQARYWSSPPLVPSPPATTGAGEQIRALIDEAQSGGATSISIDLLLRTLAASSPPATDGDAADGCEQ